MTSGGAIPDTALYDVVLEPEGTVVGTVDEDFAIESMAGDVFLLGNTSWRIRRVENGRVRVEDAGRRRPHHPLLAGRGPGPHPRAVGRGGPAARGDREPGRRPRIPTACCAWLEQACALDAGRRHAGARLRAGRPGRAGGGAHADLRGGRALLRRGGRHAAGDPRALRRAASTGPGAWRCASASAAPSTSSCRRRPPTTACCCRWARSTASRSTAIFELLRPEDVRGGADPGGPAGAHVRDALALERHALAGAAAPARGQEGPAQPAAHAGPGSAGGGVPRPDRLPGQPRRRRHRGARPPAGAARPCATAWSRPWTPRACAAFLTELHAGSIRRVARDVAEPSLFSHEILNANPYAFLDDAPLEERRSRAVSVRRGLPAEIVESLGALDPEAVGGRGREAAARGPRPRRAARPAAGPGGAARGERAARAAGQPLLRGAGRQTGARPALAVPSSGRAAASGWRPSGARWPALVWPGRPLRPRRGRAAGAAAADLRPTATGRWPRWCGRAWRSSARPPRRRLAGELGAAPPPTSRRRWPRSSWRAPCCAGSFVPAPKTAQVPQWCDRRLLARINRRTLDRLRREIEPVAAATSSASCSTGSTCARARSSRAARAWRAVIAQLQGFEAAAGAWEREILPARVADYDPAWLDELCLGGEVVLGPARVPAGGHARCPPGRRPSRWPAPGPGLAAGPARRPAAEGLLAQGRRGAGLPHALRAPASSKRS